VSLTSTGKPGELIEVTWASSAAPVEAKAARPVFNVRPVLGRRNDEDAQIRLELLARGLAGQIAEKTPTLVQGQRRSVLFTFGLKSEDPESVEEAVQLAKDAAESISQTLKASSDQ